MTEPSSLVPGRLTVFDAYHLDVARHRLWRGKHEISLWPKSWDVLSYLVEPPGLLVTNDDLHREIWPDTAVSDNIGKARMSKQGTRTTAADAADRCFRRALEIARQQESASLALRAAMSLTPLSHGRDASREARDLLRSVYASFTEGST
jgi:hypothetical protein